MGLCKVQRTASLSHVSLSHVTGCERRIPQRSWDEKLAVRPSRVQALSTERRTPRLLGWADLSPQEHGLGTGGRWPCTRVRALPRNSDPGEAQN